MKFFKILFIFWNILVTEDSSISSLPAKAKPQTQANCGSFISGKKPVILPILQGSLKLFLARSFIFGNFAPPPVKTIPAGNFGRETYLSSF